MKNKKFWFAAMLFIILGIGSGVGTYAIYKLSAGGTASVNTADFAISVNGSEISENSQTFSLSSLNWTNTLGTQVATGKIAPGSTATLPLTIDATGSEMDVDYIVKVEGFEGLTAVIDGVSGLTKTGTILYSIETNAMVKQMNVVLTWSGASNDEASKNSSDLGLKNQHQTITIIVTAFQHLTTPQTVTYPSNYAYGDLIYFDPTSGDTACSNTTLTTNDPTCMKWRVIGQDTYNVNLQLDHNIVNKVAWNTTGYNKDGPVTVLQSLANATSGWANVDSLNYTYDTTTSTPNNYGVLSCTNGVCDITKNNTSTTITGTTGANAIPPLKARLITGEEVAAITSEQTPGDDTRADTWSLATQNNFYFSNKNFITGTQTSGTGNTNLSWLVENTTSYSSSGATSNSSYGTDNIGYWTLSPRSTGAYSAFHVNRTGGLLSNSVNNDSDYGARPVITIPKSKIKQ